ncbi:circularly permutated Ras protein 1-like [Brachyhypopomus gauderio]|uniref:circularly permutated Ras protein 1-like n=1 Tax=Brachyhypopomus gauderio TaxID=698409 RepID=UPI004042AE8B
MKRCPEYEFVLSSSSSLVASSRFCHDHLAGSSTPGSEGSHRPSELKSRPGDEDKHVLPGNPNVLLVRVGSLLSEEQCECVEGEPTHCSHCGSVLESCYDNVVKECYFCQPWDSHVPQLPVGCEDCLFLLSSHVRAPSPDRGLLLFCIGTSQPLSTQSVQNAVLKCVQSLSRTHPDIGVVLLTFSHVVTVHGYGDIPSRVLEGQELSNSTYLREVGLSLPTPPPLCHTQASLQRDIYRLQESDIIALGPAALVSIMMASKHPGSKVLLLTDGVANAGLGSLNCDTRTLVSSSIFYQELGETAAAHGVSVSVVAVRGTDCRLEELGRLTDNTGGKVVISGSDELFVECLHLIEDKNIATHCTVTLLLPTVMRMRGERDAGHCGTRVLGNIIEESEVTFQYGETEKAHEALLQVRKVSVQLQVSFRRWDGLSMLRVLTATLDTTEDSSQVLSSISVSVLLHNLGQTTAALTLRGRAIEALREREKQEQLILRALEYRQDVKDQLMYSQWLQMTKLIFNKICTQTYSFSDIDAVLMYTMKNGYYRRLSLC